MNPINAKRIVVVGDSGAGKTTLARWIAEREGIPHIELDRIHWQPGWRPLEIEIFRTQTAAAVKSQQWVADGNYSQVWDIVWSRAQILIWLDFSLSITIPRLIRRTLKRIMSRELLWGANREQWSGLISPDNPIFYTLRNHTKRQNNYRRVLASQDFAHLQVVLLKSPAEVTRWKEKWYERAV